jgi:hypothetical protein
LFWLNLHSACGFSFVARFLAFPHLPSGCLALASYLQEAHVHMQGKRNGSVKDLQNKFVRFHIEDVCVPDPAKILIKLYGQDWLRGKIIDLSDRGAERGVFAVVQVGGLGYPVVVPVAKLSEEEAPDSSSSLLKHQNQL